MHPAKVSSLRRYSISDLLVPAPTRWSRRTLWPSILCGTVHEMLSLVTMHFLKFTLSLLPLAALASTNPTVTLDSGPIIGTTTSLPAASASVNKYLGIPFAAKPTGSKRFALPQIVAKWNKPIKPQKWSPACVQQFNCVCTSFPFQSELF